MSTSKRNSVIRQSSTCWRMLATLSSWLLIGFPQAEGSVPVKTFGDWQVVRDGADLSAVAFDNHGTYVALRCEVKQQICVHVLSFKEHCDKDKNYPVLVSSSSSGSYALSFTCRGLPSTTELVIESQNSIALHELLQQGGSIGFAISVRGGQFMTLNIDLKGAEEAMEYVKHYTIKQDDTELEL